MIRSLRPTDAIAFIQFRKADPVDCAVTSGGYPASSPGIGSFLNRSADLYYREPTWALIERSRIAGLVSVTVGSGNAKWEIYHLIVDTGSGFRRVVHELLEHVSAVGAEDRVPVVHLRLDTASPAVQPAIDSRFVHYAHEDVFFLGPARTDDPQVIEGIRRREPTDDLALFRLLCALRPVAARQYEGLTLREWQKIDGWVGAPIGLRRLDVSSRRDFVVQMGDSIVGWIQVDRRHNTIRIELDATARQNMDAVFEFSRSQMDVNSPARWVVRNHQEWLGGELERRGSRQVSSHLLLARPLAIRIEEPELVPMRA